MESQRALPRCLIKLMLEMEGSLSINGYQHMNLSFRSRRDLKYRVSVVESAMATSLGRLARNAPKQLIVLGIWEELAPYWMTRQVGHTPLKLMHLSPTSRINSAAYTACMVSLEDELTS